ncbi:hypothetical protein HYT84_00120, partial [Candidatus Micrarchaeota archaeon]|nr:hypothetical protein [Candidatus Micrarchaeota archaeon]
KRKAKNPRAIRNRKFPAERAGERRKKMVRGTVYSTDMVQVNLKVIQAGPTPLGEIFKQEPKKEEKK